MRITMATNEENPRPEIQDACDASLQKYSLELLACLDEMKYRRDVIHQQILREREEQARLQTDLKRLTENLVNVNEKICDHVITRNKLDQVVAETESSFRNMATGSENLLNFMKRVTANIRSLILESEVAEEGIARIKKKERSTGLMKK